MGTGNSEHVGLMLECLADMVLGRQRVRTSTHERGPGMDFYDYESRLCRPSKVKIPDFQDGERLNHVVFAEQFTPALLERLGRSADRIRLLSKSKEGGRFLNDLLRHKRSMLYFTQPSTRTFLSFMAACQILGMSCAEVRDPRTSSEAKGESQIDSIRMFSSYFDVVIMRSNVAKFAECCAYMMNDLHETSRRNIPIINGGAGSDEHPTQALLDIYTIQRAMSYTHPRDSVHGTWFGELRHEFPDLLKGIDGKKFAFCGDICRGRTIRSLAILLSQYENITMYFIGPSHATLALPREFRSRLLAHGVNVIERNSFLDIGEHRPIIEEIDCLYMTRIQREHNTPEDEQAFGEMDFTNYKLTPELVDRMKTHASILHPFPRDEQFGEIPTSIDVDPRAYYFRQARNGMWIRSALLAYLFDVDSVIADYHQDYTSQPLDFDASALGG
ncbi:MAG TPA: aspartate carbamoyltransferase [Planctomycetes bacterium]|nr:aspartate carbamoyltransferase [Planctomycetota bacterium]